MSLLYRIILLLTDLTALYMLWHLYIKYMIKSPLRYLLYTGSGVLLVVILLPEKKNLIKDWRTQK